MLTIWFLSSIKAHRRGVIDSSLCATISQISGLQKVHAYEPNNLQNVINENIRLKGSWLNAITATAVYITRLDGSGNQVNILIFSEEEVEAIHEEVYKRLGTNRGKLEKEINEKFDGSPIAF